jgi:hypothetical protein
MSSSKRKKPPVRDGRAAVDWGNGRKLFAVDEGEEIDRGANGQRHGVDRDGHE